MKLIATKGMGETSIDDVISTAEVSRGTFYKYYPSPEALFHDLAVEIANELISMAEPFVLSLEDPAERVACGFRIVAKLAIHHPLAAGFIVRLGWPDLRGPTLLLDFVRRDLADGIRQKRFISMPVDVAVNIVAGTVLGAAHGMLKPGCPRNFAEHSAAAILRALGVDAASAHRIANKPLKLGELKFEGVLARTLERDANESDAHALATQQH